MVVLSNVVVGRVTTLCNGVVVISLETKCGQLSSRATPAPVLSGLTVL